MLQIKHVRVSARTVWRSRRRYTAGRPLHTIRSCLHIVQTKAHRTRRNVDHLAGFAEKPTEKPTERRSVSVSFFFFSVSLKKTTETDRLLGEKPKNRPSHFLLSVHNPARIPTMNAGMEHVGFFNRTGRYCLHQARKRREVFSKSLEG